MTCILISPCLWSAVLLLKDFVKDLSDLFFRTFTAISFLFRSHSTAVSCFSSSFEADDGFLNLFFSKLWYWLCAFSARFSFPFFLVDFLLLYFVWVCVEFCENICDSFSGDDHLAFLFLDSRDENSLHCRFDIGDVPCSFEFFQNLLNFVLSCIPLFVL